MEERELPTIKKEEKCCLACPPLPNPLLHKKHGREGVAYD
jgi:hypothetical protein